MRVRIDAARLAILLSCCLGSGAATAATSGSVCLTPHAALSLGYPGGPEVNTGVTLGHARVNAMQSCSGLMLDVGSNLQAARAAVGLRTFQRYDWPVAAQVDAFYYHGYRDDSAFPGRRCGGLEAGYGVLMSMLRLGVGRCPGEGRTFGVLHLGFFY